MMGSHGEPWGGADEASLAHPPLTSCCVARFLTGTPGLEDPQFSGWRESPRVGSVVWIWVWKEEAAMVEKRPWTWSQMSAL